MKIKFLAVLVVLGLGIGVRTVRLWEDFAFRQSNAREEAQQIVFEQVKAQLKDNMTPKIDVSPGPRPEKRDWDHMVWNLISQERTQFDQSVNALTLQIEQRNQDRDVSRSFLLESDSYYYYYLTKHIVDSGKLSDQRKPGFFYNKLRQAPKGSWDWFTLHPYLGAVWYKMVSLVNPRISLMASLAWLPVALSSFCIVIFFGICTKFNINFLASCFGAIAFALCPMFVQRSLYGWYDTDLYIYIWVMVWFFVSLTCQQKSKKFYLWNAFLGVWIGVLSLFWIGWQVVLLFCSIAVVAAALLEWFAKRDRFPAYGFALIVFVASALPVGILLLNFEAFQDLFGRQISEARTIGGSSENDLWPNLFFFVGELAVASFKKIIYLNGGWLNWALAITGVVSILINSISPAVDLRSKQNAWSLLGLFVGGLLLTLKAQRFDHFLVIPFCILLAMGSERIVLWARTFLKLKGSSILTAIKEQYLNRFLYAFLTVFFIAFSGPVTIASVSQSVYPILNPVWTETLSYLKNQSPQDATVFSLWSPGYFVQAIGERRTVLDGGTPTAPENVWFAKAMMTHDERLSAGIFRMMLTSGNDAFQFLTDHGYQPQAATDKILELVRVSRSDAMKILSETRLSEQDKVQLLDLTHGTKVLSSAFVMVYDNLIEQNIMLSILANWNLDKAVLIQRTAKSMKLKLSHKDMFKLMPDSVWNYLPEGLLFQKKEDQLIFVNGIRIAKDFSVGYVSGDGKDRKKEERAYSIIQTFNNDWREVKASQFDTFASIIVSEEANGLKAVGAHAQLAQSILFRLYYGNAAKLTLFKHFYTSKRDGSKSRVALFEIDWKNVVGDA